MIHLSLISKQCLKVIFFLLSHWRGVHELKKLPCHNGFFFFFITFLNHASAKKMLFSWTLLSLQRLHFIHKISQDLKAEPPLMLRTHGRVMRIQERGFLNALLADGVLTYTSVCAHSGKRLGAKFKWCKSSAGLFPDFTLAWWHINRSFKRWSLKCISMHVL